MICLLAAAPSDRPGSSSGWMSRSLSSTMPGFSSSPALSTATSSHHSTASTLSLLVAVAKGKGAELDNCMPPRLGTGVLGVAEHASPTADAVAGASRGPSGGGGRVPKNAWGSSGLFSSLSGVARATDTPRLRSASLHFQMTRVPRSTCPRRPPLLWPRCNCTSTAIRWGED